MASRLQLHKVILQRGEEGSQGRRSPRPGSLSNGLPTGRGQRVYRLLPECAARRFLLAQPHFRNKRESFRNGVGKVLDFVCRHQFTECFHRPARLDAGRRRSEEHTSELQSLTNLVCRLLLEKKKNTPHSSLIHTS